MIVQEQYVEFSRLYDSSLIRFSLCYHGVLCFCCKADSWTVHNYHADQGGYQGSMTHTTGKKRQEICQRQTPSDAAGHAGKDSSQDPSDEVDGHKVPMTMLANSAVYLPDRVASAPVHRPCTYPEGHVHFSFRSEASKRS